MVWIYHLENHATYAPLSTQILQACESGSNRAVTSVITLLEVLVKPEREGNTIAVNDYRIYLSTFPNLRMVPIDHDVAARAAAIRAHDGIRTPDALQIAAAMHAGAGCIVGNDRAWMKVNGIDIILLDDLL